MMDSSPQELKLTPDLLEHARAVALKEARKHCPEHVSYDDVVQEVILQLVRKPPKFDPSRGASVKTFLYTVVRLAVLKFAEREAKHAYRFRQFAEPVKDEEPEEHLVTENRPKELTRSRWSMDDILKFIEGKDSQALCRLVIECNGNLSEAARRLGLSEGTVRYRLKTLAPKLVAAGFDPFSTGGIL